MTPQPTPSPATITIGGDLQVGRVGFGAMQLTGKQVWGPYPDHDGGVALLRALLDEGVTFIDTADVYGPHTNELLIREALHPYPEGLTIASKGGFVRGGYDYSTLGSVGNPKYLRQAAVTSLRRLGLDRFDLYYLHSGYATDAPFEDQVGELKKMQDEGYIRHIGLSNVTTEQFDVARSIADIAAVTALYNIGNRTGAGLLAAAEQSGAVFSPWHPVSLRDGGENADQVARTLAPLATRYEATPQQIALAWLLHRSPAMLPIPGTTSLGHLRENVAAMRIRLTDAEVAELTALVPEPVGQTAP
ncbi:aryl-alcohol dehydrogenase-like predicted oxidoreductase [Micromonospora pisi]|uniref:Aryl-alcohol dehydrogenase-like predicted oxidoreductase n=1 Tax=Micromonospora pisi TaxID=589240 RepID=A0A495JDN9_9ACTN|nr:aldo/keto reductase [Micromonospora pisi]RKR86484.1 aryl-alcohol dehydrogenase-like predicted oxidoreductase [Micromonospora pisi]